MALHHEIPAAARAGAPAAVQEHLPRPAPAAMRGSGAALAAGAGGLHAQVSSGVAQQASRGLERRPWAAPYPCPPSATPRRLQVAQPARDRTLVVYVYSDSDPAYRENLDYFLRVGVAADDPALHYVIVIQAGDSIQATGLPPSLLLAQSSSNVQVLIVACKVRAGCWGWGGAGGGGHY